MSVITKGLGSMLLVTKGYGLSKIGKFIKIVFKKIENFIEIEGKATDKCQDC